MIKRVVIKRSVAGLEADACGSGVWIRVGRQLHRRRTQLGFDVGHVASSVGISASTYAGYEAGVQAPAFLLAQIADLFGVPVVSFFQDVAREAIQDEAESAQPAAFRVATPEYREQMLTEFFRGLDIEDQQYVLAISKALSKAKAGGEARLTG